MGFFLDSLRALGTTLRNVLRPATTVEFPDVIRPRPDRHRVSFALLIDETGDEACIGCLACERICPSHVIAVKQAPKRESKVTGKKRGYAEDFTIDMEACIFCELCVQVCPTDAVVMCRTPEEPGFCREDLVLTMDKLYANQKLRPLSWGTGGKLMEMQDPARGKADAKAKGGDAEGEKAAETGAEKPKKVVKPKAAKAAPDPASSGVSVTASPDAVVASAKPAATEPPLAIPETKTDVKTEPKTEPDAKAVPDTKVDAQADVKTDPKVDAKELP